MYCPHKLGQFIGWVLFLWWRRRDLNCILPLVKLRFGSVQPSPATVPRTVAVTLVQIPSLLLLCDKIDFILQAYCLQSEINGFSHGLKACHRHAFLTAFQIHFSFSVKKEKAPRRVLSLWRRRRDLNPRYPFGVYTISNRARSASYATSPSFAISLHIILHLVPFVNPYF